MAISTRESADGSWSQLGTDAASRTLQTRIVGALKRAGDAAGLEPWAGDEVLESEDAAIAQLEVASDLVVGLLRGGDATRTAALSELLVEVEGVRRAVADHRVRRRSSALVSLQAGLGRLRGIGSVSAMLEKATVEACRSCGFDRAILFRVQDSTMVAQSVHYHDDPDSAQTLLDAARNAPADLNHMLLETEMIRRRMPMLVRDAQNDPRVFKLVADISDSQSYVAAPIMPEGRVIGFLHADCYFQRRHVDEFDRDLLWAFAEGFGYAFERTLLMERMRAQREQVRGLVDATEQLMDELCDTETELERVARQDSEVASRTTAMLAGAPSRLDQLLTRREIEVIGLMASGATNAQIADRLVISEGTVKSHVKHILRKLRAANRAEAVSRYLRISSLNGPS